MAAVISGAGDDRGNSGCFCSGLRDSFSRSEGFSVGDGVWLLVSLFGLGSTVAGTSEATAETVGAAVVSCDGDGAEVTCSLGVESGADDESGAGDGVF